MPPQLVAITEGPNLLLDKPIVLIGRHQECDIQIPSRKISRRHCCIAQVNHHLTIRVLCSTNGIRINGVRMLEGDLKPGDELTIGSYRYQLNWPSQDVASAPPAVGKIANLELIALGNQDGLDSCEEPMALPEPQPFAAKKKFGPILPVAPTVPPVAPLHEQIEPSNPPSLGIPDDMPIRPL